MTAEALQVAVVSTVIERMNELQSGVFPSLRRRGGRASNKRPRSEMARTGWSLTSRAAECVLKHGV